MVACRYLRPNVIIELYLLFTFYVISLYFFNCHTIYITLLSSAHFNGSISAILKQSIQQQPQLLKPSKLVEFNSSLSWAISIPGYLACTGILNKLYLQLQCYSIRPLNRHVTLLFSIVTKCFKQKEMQVHGCTLTSNTGRMYTDVQHTCEGLNTRPFKETCRTVLIVPVSLCCQVPAIVDVIVLLLDLQAVEVCWRDCAHVVQAGEKRIQPTVRTQKHRQSVHAQQGEVIA